MKKLTLPTRRKPPDKHLKKSKRKPSKPFQSTSNKRKRDTSNQNQQQTQRVPFWNDKCSVFSSFLHFGVQNEPKKIEEKEWKRKDKKLARRGWFDCKFYEHSVSKNIRKKWYCHSWKNVTAAIELEEKR
jgi:hypothetical protein